MILLPGEIIETKHCSMKSRFSNATTVHLHGVEKVQQRGIRQSVLVTNRKNTHSLYWLADDGDHDDDDDNDDDDSDVE